MSSRRFHRVAVLKGGWSAERDVSLVSGHACAVALREAGYEVVELDAGRDVAQQVAESAPDCVFNALHGRWGEDGCVQGLLECVGVPYTHSGVLASALAMDKDHAKRIFAEAGLPVVESVLATRAEVASGHPIEPPYVVKPYNEGSSVGIYFVMEGANGPAQLDENAPETLMVERYVPGRELTVAVMGDRALTVTDIVATAGWYDYHAKYSTGGSSHILPAELPAPIFDACLEGALGAHKALGCRGVSRTDFRWDETRGLDGLAILEVNTQPGMTPTSLAPEQAAHCGVGFSELCEWIVEDASCDR